MSLNISLDGIYNLEASLAHGAFNKGGGMVNPFRREPLLERNADGSPRMADYALMSDDPEQREVARKFAQRLLRIVWQSRSDRVQWSYAQLADKLGVATAMHDSIGNMVADVIGQLGGGATPTFYQDDGEFFANTLAALDANMLLYLLREPGERMLIVTRMQAESNARYEKREVPTLNGQFSLFGEFPKKEDIPAMHIGRVPSIPKVPVYSGNAIRNGIGRRFAARFILEHFGWYVPMDSFRNLFVGGALVRSGEKGLNVDALRQRNGLMPMYGLFGGPYNSNSMSEGSNKCKKAWPLVREAKTALHPSLHSEAELLSMRDIMAVESYSKREDAAMLVGQFLQDKTVVGGGEIEDKTSAMFFETEVMIAGTKLAHQWNLYQTNELELGALISAYSAWSTKPTLGGMSQRGHGQARLEYRAGNEFFMGVTGNELKLSAQAQGCFDLYRAHLDKSKKEIQALLRATETPATNSAEVNVQAIQMEMVKAEVD